jgi:hypothetical protein
VVAAEEEAEAVEAVEAVEVTMSLSRPETAGDWKAGSRAGTVSTH